MKAATLFLGFTGLVLVGMLVLLWQAFGPRSGQAAKPATVAQTRAAPALRPTETETGGVRSVYLGPSGGGSRPAPEPQRERPSATAAVTPPDTARLAAPATSAPAPFETAPVEEAPAAGEHVDLNTATLEQLNELGAGMIGRTIIANRPYASPDDLVNRRVLTRRDYETIRPHVTAR